MKRTLALILTLLMVFAMIPASLINALAHGPGVGGNDYTNQTIDNAPNQAIPEVVVVDGDYKDTAWNKDKWLEADKRYGVWDVEDPLNLNYSYKYQVRVDAEYLYGVFQLSNTKGDELVLWLNDGSVSGKCSDKIVISLNGASVTGVTVNGVAMADADAAAGAVPAEQYQLVAKANGTGVVVEFRFFLDSFTEGSTLTHYTSVTVDGETLYYPKVELGKETIPNSPETEWPSNAIAIERTDLESSDSNKHLPVDITIDGKLNEVVWSELTDYRITGNTSHQQTLEIEAGTSAPLNLLSVGYNTESNTFIPDHTHVDSVNGSSWNCVSTSGACTAGDLTPDQQIRFKYEMRTDGTNLYGAVVVFDHGNINHNLPTDFTDNGVSNWESHYADLSFLVIDIYDAAGTSVSRKLDMVYSDTVAKRDFNVYGSSYSDYKGGLNAGAIRTGMTIYYEFKIALADIYGSSIPGNIKMDIRAFEEGNFNNLYKVNTTTKLNSDNVSAWARSRGVTVSSNNCNGYVGNITANGGLTTAEWNNLLAADSYVNGMYRGSNLDNGNILTYQYDIAAGYDYIYGAAIMVTESGSFKTGTKNNANVFRLWLNDNVDTKYSSLFSFWINGNKTEASIATYLGDNKALTHDLTKNAQGVYTYTSNGKLNHLYGLEAEMRILDENDLIDPEKRTQYAALYQAIKDDRVAIVEFKIPMDLANVSMPYNREGNGSDIAFNYYISCDNGIGNSSHSGLVSPIQTETQNSDKWLVFTPDSWCHSGDREVLVEDYYDIVVIDGVRTEYFWNKYDDFIGINGSTGYYSEAVSTEDVFTFGQTIYASRDHLYGFIILNGKAVWADELTEASSYTLWLNNAPEAFNHATHSFTFWFASNGELQVKGYDWINSVSIDTTDMIFVKGNTLNGYSNLEFAIDTTTIDPNNTGYEYACHATNITNGVDPISLYYPDPRDSVADHWNELVITHVDPGNSDTNKLVDGSANIYPENHAATSFNGWAHLYIHFAPINMGNADRNTKVYRVAAVDSDRDGAYELGAIPAGGFMYTLYATDNAEYNPDPNHRNALLAKYRSIFTVDTLIEIDGLDFTGDDKLHTRFRVMDDMLYVNSVNEGWKALIITNNNGDSVGISSGLTTNADDFVIAKDGNGNNIQGDVGHNGWAGTYIAFAPTAVAGMYEVVAVDGNCNGTVDIEFPTGGFVYHAYNTCLSVEGAGWHNGETSYVRNIEAKFTVGTLVYFNGMDWKNMNLVNMESFGYRIVEPTWSGRNKNLPSESNWVAKDALKIGSLGYFFPEEITVDGYLNDSGWDDDGWTRVEEGVNGSLQARDYARNGADGFNYSYQFRSDGEYIYVAAILDVNAYGIPKTLEDGSEFLSVPSFRVWIKSNDAEYKDAISFTHLYDVRLGLDSSSSNYTNWADYTQTVINNIDLVPHGQTFASDAWYFANTVNSACEHVTHDNGTLTYNAIKLRFAEHLPNGYTHPWGGMQDKINNKPTTEDHTKYGETAILGETIEIMENVRSGANGNSEEWYAETDTKGFSLASEHAAWRATDEYGGAQKTVVEFKFHLKEIGCEDGDSFEYYVQAAASGVSYDHPFTMFSPAIQHIPNQEKKSFNAYNLPFWVWRTATSSKYNASTEYNMMLRNNYGPAVSLGCMVNDNYNDTGKAAIRFGGLYSEEYIRRQIVTNNYEAGYDSIDGERDLSGANKDGITNYWDVANVGIVFMPSTKVQKAADGTLDLTVETAGANVGSSVGIYQWNQNPDSNFADYTSYAFYVTLKNIPDTDAAKNMKFSFRSFVQYYAADGSPAYYDRILERSYNSIENAANEGYMPGGSGDIGGGEEGGGEGEIVKPNHNGAVIAYIPLDNRPVNVDRAYYLAQSSGFQLLMPPAEYYSTEINNLDTPEYESSVGNPEALLAWLKDVDNDVYGEVDYYVISLDQLFSGGLVGSRDFAGINDLPNAENDGATYDPELTFEKTIASFLGDLTANTDNKVVYFDSQMRLASTGAFNGYEVNPHYQFLRGYFALAERAKVEIADDVDTAEEYYEVLDQIIAGYEKDVNGNYILGESIYNANGTVKDKTFTKGGYTVHANMIDRYIRSRIRKMEIDIILSQEGVFENAEYFYIGIDDSYPKPTIQTAETQLLDKMGEASDGYSVFAGIDEIGLMSMAALVTSVYGSVNVSVQYFGNGANYSADDYGDNTLKENVDVHITGVGANLTTTANKNALEVLVLTKKQESNATGAANDPEAIYVNDLINRLKSNLAQGIPTAVVDGSAGTRDVLGRAIVNAAIAGEIELTKIFGYSNWNTVANSTGISISNAVARYSYLTHSDEITDASHEGFLMQIGYSFIKDVAYISDYKSAISGSDTAANRESIAYVFNNTAYSITTAMRGKQIPVALGGEYAYIGDLVITKPLYWPWNRNFEASFGLGIRNTTNEKDLVGTKYLADLNDNQAAEEFRWSGVDEWFAVTNNGSNDYVTYDFGIAHEISQIKVHLFNGDYIQHEGSWIWNGGIAPCDGIEAFALNENGEYVSIGHFTVNSTSGAVYWATLNLNTPMSVKGLKIVFDPSNTFIMANEIVFN